MEPKNFAEEVTINPNHPRPILTEICSTSPFQRPTITTKACRPCYHQGVFGIIFCELGGKLMSFFWNDGSGFFGLNHHPKRGAQDLNPESYRAIGIRF